MTSDISFDSQAAAAAQPAGPTASTSFDFQTQPLTAQPSAAVPTLQSLSMAQPMRHGREPTGDTPIPRSKRQKDDDYDLNVSPLAEGFHRHPPGSAGGAPMVTPSVAPSTGPVPPCHTPPLATLAEEEVVEELCHRILTCHTKGPTRQLSCIDQEKGCSVTASPAANPSASSRPVGPRGRSSLGLLSQGGKT